MGGFTECIKYAGLLYCLSKKSKLSFTGKSEHQRGKQSFNYTVAAHSLHLVEGFCFSSTLKILDTVISKEKRQGQ